MKAIINCQLVTERGIIWDAVLLVENGVIKDFGKMSKMEIPEGAEIIDAEGAYVGPGFVDIHNHGGNGFSSSQHPVEACEFFLKHGTTTMLATPDYSMNFETMLDR